MDTYDHCMLNLNLRLDMVRAIWANLDDKRRMEVLKSVIWTAPNNHEFHAKALKVIGSPRFLETLD